MDDDDFPVILGFGGVNELGERDQPEPRLSGMRSVSAAGARGLHKTPRQASRPAGFVHGKVRAVR